MSTSELRPGLAYWPDAEMYDEAMANLERELGHKPSPAEIVHDLMPAVQLSVLGLPCKGCGDEDAPIVGAFVPDWEQVELVGYTLCRACGEQWEKDPKLVARVNAQLLIELREELGTEVH